MRDIITSFLLIMAISLTGCATPKGIDVKKDFHVNYKNSEHSNISKENLVIFRYLTSVSNRAIPMYELEVSKIIPHVSMSWSLGGDPYLDLRDYGVTMLKTKDLLKTPILAPYIYKEIKTKLEAKGIRTLLVPAEIDLDKFGNLYLKSLIDYPPASLLVDFGFTSDMSQSWMYNGVTTDYHASTYRHELSPMLSITTTKFGKENTLGAIVLPIHFAYFSKLRQGRNDLEKSHGVDPLVRITAKSKSILNEEERQANDNFITNKVKIDKESVYLIPKHEIITKNLGDFDSYKQNFEYISAIIADSLSVIDTELSLKCQKVDSFNRYSELNNISCDQLGDISAKKITLLKKINDAEFVFLSTMENEFLNNLSPESLKLLKLIADRESEESSTISTSAFFGVLANSFTKGLSTAAGFSNTSANYDAINLSSNLNLLRDMTAEIRDQELSKGQITQPLILKTSMEINSDTFGVISATSLEEFREKIKNSQAFKSAYQ
tara:strand:+ start:2037 stop:3515 length:1479 start_codon:yes stop_codon:yes gene_type:complete